ncbi:hypothetical protein RIVM261_065420 [Rivularia sp. IAM M-261]|nr:hypothetical protein RIVM261_065420 [Rivularia sp. IAM M-261]
MDAEELLQRYQKGERDFSGVDLGYAKLENVDLKDINLSKAYLMGVKLNNANLTGAKEKWLNKYLYGLIKDKIKCLGCFCP